MDYTIYIYHDSGIKVVSAFLRMLGVAHVNPCQSPSKSCHRNDPGDDESTSCYRQCKNSLSPIQVHRRYFQHAHFIPIVGVGKGGEY